MSEDSPPLTPEPEQRAPSHEATELDSSYQTNLSPELERPPPTDEAELVPLSPESITASKFSDTGYRETPSPESPFGELPPPPGVSEDWTPNKIVRRADWGAAKPRWIKTLEVPINKVVVSFTETDPCYTEEECVSFVKTLQQQHMAEDGIPDIKHNFLIGGDNTIYEGRGYMRLGPTYKPSAKKIEELTGKSIDIAIIERSASLPSKEVVTSLALCLAIGVKQNLIDKDFATYYVVDNEIDEVRPPKTSEHSDQEQLRNEST